MIVKVTRKNRTPLGFRPWKVCIDEVAIGCYWCVHFDLSLDTCLKYNYIVKDQETTTGMLCDSFEKRHDC